MSKENWTFTNIPDLTGKVIIVTGGNSGIGYEAVKAFAEKDAEVIMASRNPEKAVNAKKEIITEIPQAKVLVMELDLSSLDSVKKFSQAFKNKYDQLDVLLNNAGIMMTPYHLTKDGFEGQMGTNHYGHFALTGQLLELITKTPKSRVINISSNAHKWGQMDFDKLSSENGTEYSPRNAYSISKLSNLLFTYELQRKFEEAGIDSLAVAAHPGVSQTNLLQHMEGKILFKIMNPIMKLMLQKADMGSLPGIRASVDPNVKGAEYYGPNGRREFKGYPVKVESIEASRNLEDAKKLWDISEKLTGVKFQF
ncbi:MAG: SDR family NAD(P)-dependent oxidoreductase [Bacteroidetes bacterium]|nr:SDR family NAD(P)-dependent oxidoreductase [Bacteroidota bacterium]